MEGKLLLAMDALCLTIQLKPQIHSGRIIKDHAICRAAQLPEGFYIIYDLNVGRSEERR